jgi:hypothetical protein
MLTKDRIRIMLPIPLKSLPPGLYNDFFGEKLVFGARDFSENGHAITIRTSGSFKLFYPEALALR